MAKRKKSLSSSDSSSSSSSDSDSSTSESPGHRRNKSKDERKPQEKTRRGNVKPKEKVEDRKKRSPETRSSDRKRRHSDSQSKSKTTDSKSTRSKDDDRRRNRSSDRSRDRHRSRSKKERSKSPRGDKKKNLFPIVNKGDNVTLDLESGKKSITETTLVSYPNLNKSLTENRSRNEDDRKRRQTSPERFKSMSSTITVTHNPESEKRPLRSPVQRPPVERSLRDRVGWDPFQGTKSSSFGDHDDRQLTGGYNDSYTRKEFGRGRGRGWSRGGGRGFRTDSRPRMGGGGGGGGMWSNNRNFSRSNSETLDRSGINDKKWKRDLFTDD